MDVLRRLGWAAQCVAGQPLTPQAARAALADAPGIGAARAPAVVEGLARRNLLLRGERDAAGGLGLQRLSFVHAQLREYLAGAHIAEQWALDAAAAEASLAPHWFDAQWTEVLAFAIESLSDLGQRDAFLAAALRAPDAFGHLLHRSAFVAAVLLARVSQADPALVAAVVRVLEALVADEPALREPAADRLLGLAAHAPAWPALERFARGDGAWAAWADEETTGEWQRLQALRGRLRAVEALAGARGAASVRPLLAAQPAAGRDAVLAIAELCARLGEHEAAQQAWRALFDTGDGDTRREVAASMARASEGERCAAWLAERLARAGAELADLRLAAELKLPLDLADLWRPLVARVQAQLDALPPDEGFAPEGLSAAVYALLDTEGRPAAVLPEARALVRAALQHPALAWYVGPRVTEHWTDLRAEATRAMGRYVRLSITEPERVRADFSRQNAAARVVCDEPDDTVAVPELLSLLELVSAARSRSDWPIRMAASLARRGQVEAGLQRLRPQLALPAGSDDRHPDAAAHGRRFAWLAVQALAPERLDAELDALHRRGEPETDAARLAAAWGTSGVAGVAAAWFEALAQAPGGHRFLEVLAQGPEGEPAELARHALGEPDVEDEPSEKERRHWGPTEAEAAFSFALEEGWYVDASDQETTATVSGLLGLLDEVDAAAAPALVDRWVQQVLPTTEAEAGTAAVRLAEVLNGLSARGWTSPHWPAAAAAVARLASPAQRAGLLGWLWAHA